MLVLGVRPQEYVMLVLPDNRTVKVMLVDILHIHKARLGFVAPDDVKILRQDVYERMER